MSSHCETWLKNNKYLLVYVTKPGYLFIYHNEDERRGGDCELILKETPRSRI